MSARNDWKTRIIPLLLSMIMCLARGVTWGCSLPERWAISGLLSWRTGRVFRVTPLTSPPCSVLEVAKHGPEDPAWGPGLNPAGSTPGPTSVNSNMLGPDRVHDAKNNYNLMLFWQKHVRINWQATLYKCMCVLYLKCMHIFWSKFSVKCQKMQPNRFQQRCLHNFQHR